MRILLLLLFSVSSAIAFQVRMPVPAGLVTSPLDSRYIPTAYVFKEPITPKILDGIGMQRFLGLLCYPAGINERREFVLHTYAQIKPLQVVAVRAELFEGMFVATFPKVDGFVFIAYIEGNTGYYAEFPVGADPRWSKVANVGDNTQPFGFRLEFRVPHYTSKLLVQFGFDPEVHNTESNYFRDQQQASRLFSLERAKYIEALVSNKPSTAKGQRLEGKNRPKPPTVKIDTAELLRDIDRAQVTYILNCYGLTLAQFIEDIATPETKALYQKQFKRPLETYLREILPNVP